MNGMSKPASISSASPPHPGSGSRSPPSPTRPARPRRASRPAATRRRRAASPRPPCPSRTAARCASKTRFRTADLLSPSAGGPSPAGRRTRSAPRPMPRLLHHPLGELAGRFDVGRVVHQDQGLERRVGPRPADGADLAVRGVERRQRRRRAGPLPERVHRPAVQVLAVALLVRLGRPVRSVGAGHQLLPQPGGWYGETLLPPISPLSSPLTASAWSRMNSACSRNRGPRASRRFSGSFAQQLRRDRRRLAVGRRRDDQACISFARPSRTRGTRPPASRAAPGATGSSPCEPKSSAVLTRPGAEEHLPVAVDGDAGGQRVLGSTQPLRQAEPIGRWRRPGQRRQRRRACRRVTFSPFLSYCAADEDERVARLRHLLHHHRVGDRPFLVPRSASAARRLGR